MVILGMAIAMSFNQQNQWTAYQKVFYFVIIMAIYKVTFNTHFIPKSISLSAVTAFFSNFVKKTDFL